MATKQRKIGAIIALDGEQAFKKSVTECNKALTTMKSEMKLVAAETTGNANSLDSLKKKHETLQKVLDASVDKEEAVQKGLDHAKEDYEKVGKKLDEYKSKLSDAQKALKDMEESQNASADAISDQKEVIAGLSSDVESIEKVYATAGNRVQDWETKLNSAKTETIKATAALKENDTYMDEAARSTDNCATSIDEFGNKAQKVKTDITDVGNVIKVNLINTLVDAGKQLAKTTFDSAIQGATGLQDATNQLAAATGASTESLADYSDVMSEIYSENYGDSLDSIADTMSRVMQYTNETDPDNIKKLTENAIALNDTFDIDINESLRAATTLMENFGLTSDEAYDMMAKGAQNGLNKSDELADNISEYGQLWSQAGFSAEEMFSIMENGLESGAYNLDKVNDFVKEFGNSLADGRVEDHLSSFSSNTQDLFYQWKNGQATTKEVFNSVINDLSEMTNKQEALSIASDTWSALGEDNSMKVITSLNKVNDAYEDVEGTMEDIKDIKYDSVAQAWEKLGRTFQTEIAVPIAEDFLPIAEKGIDLVAENLETLIPVVAGIGTAFAAEKLVTGIMSVTATITASIAATEGATTAMTIFNTVLSANPAVAIAAGIGVLTTAALLLSNNVETAKTATQELADAASEVNSSALNAADELDAATSSISDAMTSNSASAGTAYRLVDELEELSNKSSRTATEQSRMSTIVAELNTMFPEMSLSIDDVTGSLSMGIEEIDAYVESAVEMGKIEAVQKAVKEATEKLVDAEIEQTKAQEQLEETTDALNTINEKRAEAEQAVIDKQEAIAEAQDAYNEAVAAGEDNLAEYVQVMTDTTEAQIEYNGEMMNVSAAMQQMNEDEITLTETQKGQQEALDVLNESLAEGQSEIDTYTQYLQDNTSVTAENTAATGENTAAAQANADAQAAQSEAAQASIDVAGQQLDAYTNLSTAQQTMATDVTNAVLTMQESVQSSLESQMNMFEEFDGGVEVSTQTLLDNMQSQIDGVTNWEQQLAELADKGIDQDLLQSLIDMGPEGTSYVTAFNNMTTEELAKANDLWGQSVDIKNMTNEWGDELTQGVGELAAGSEQAWNDLASNLNMQANESGQYVVQGLVDGMSAAQSQASNEGKDLGVKTIDGINTGAGVASPSTKTKKSGQYIVEGLTKGIEGKKSTAVQKGKTLGSDTATAVKTGIDSKKTTVTQSAQSLANSVVSTMTSGLRNGQNNVSVAAANLATSASNAVSRNAGSSSAYYAGYNLAIGMANGIYGGRSSVITAAANMASSAIRAAKNALGIHSPSKVFQEIGSFAAQGFPIGFEGQTANIERSVSSAMNSISAAAISGIDFGTGYSGGSYSGGNSGQNVGDLTLQIPMYVNGVLTQTQVEKISLNALSKSQRKINSAKGVKNFAIA